PRSSSSDEEPCRDAPAVLCGLLRSCTSAKARKGPQESPCGSADGDVPLGEPLLRVERLAGHSAPVELEVQVRAGGLALAAHLGDLVPGVDDVPGLDVVVLHVAVDLDVAVGVLDVAGVTEARRRTGPEDDAVGG